MTDIAEKILKLKHEKNAIILAHNYQRSEIFDVADFVGDSLALCLESSKVKADIIVFCGVYFMAESAAILNPGKKVLMPDIDAGCAMADMVDVRGLVALQKKYPLAKTVAYVNSSAEVKFYSDICCTSSNAVEVVKSLGVSEVIFVPDKNLAAYVQSKLPAVNVIPWDGFCPMHHAVGREDLIEAKVLNPQAKIIAHPESRGEVLQMADFIASTSGMIDCASSDDATDYIVLTECGMSERLQRALPTKRFHGLCNMCFDMKKNTLTTLYETLLNEKNVVRVDSKVARGALKSFEAMFNLSSK